MGLAGVLGTRRVSQYYQTVRWLQQMTLLDLDSVELPAQDRPLATTSENVHLLRMQRVLASCSDGLLLCRLLARVTNTTIPVPFPSPVNAAQRQSNLRMAFQAMENGESRGSSVGGGRRRVPVAVLDLQSEVAEGKVDSVLTVLLAVKRCYTLVAQTPPTSR